MQIKTIGKFRFGLMTKIVNVSEISLKFDVKKESDKSRTLCMD